MAPEVVIGVDVGGTTVAAGLVDPDGRVLEHHQVPTHARGPGTALETIGELLDRLGERARARGVTVTGVGLGVPGIIDAERGAVGVDIHYAPELARAPLGAMLRERVGVPVFVDNDVNALALAEWTWGAGRGARSLVMLALGTGVGGGIIVDGRLHRGHAGFGGELGHVPIDFDGPPCVCGGRGCLKAYVSGTDIALRAGERLGRPVSAAEVFRLAAEGDAAADAIVEAACAALGAGLSIIVNGLNPERVLLAGSVAKSLRPLEARVRAALARYAFAEALRATHLEILALDKDATVRGGAALVH
ncbi:MAG TPA: ROK family protein, partial [Methylomirabilota bacterium]|nr:ROK family protein [Methylomirabilota bacterium]